jgi:hypothetical protein
MPDTFGKRERRKVQERKAAARDDRRIARNRRRQGLPAEMSRYDPFAQMPDPPPEATGGPGESDGPAERTPHDAP